MPSLKQTIAHIQELNRVERKISQVQLKLDKAVAIVRQVGLFPFVE